ncbi:MAG: hypothetical protein IKN54_05160 [Lachnospiraceae bacterium]|nr:hypothetical protein [Lachnospiraceae bacterium]
MEHFSTDKENIYQKNIIACNHLYCYSCVYIYNSI